MSKYDEIMELPHHVSTRHPPMSRESRAAQFGAFAALSGYDDAVRETARQTDEKVVQEEEQVDRLNRKLVFLAAHLDDEPVVIMTYFEPDKQKAGGAYRTVEGTVRRIDGFESVIELSTEGGRVRIPMDAMVALESEYSDDEGFEDGPSDFYEP